MELSTSTSYPPPHYHQGWRSEVTLVQPEETMSTGSHLPPTPRRSSLASSDANMLAVVVSISVMSRPSTKVVGLMPEA